ncbi:MAG: zinc ribbon domain-containing protein [Anaerolineales bacterium]|jgi:putative FmdB family regulatory protein
MPLYEFVCEECGKLFEELVRSASAVGEVICPECNSERVQKMVSTFASKIAGSSAFSSGASSAACNPGSV